MRIGFSLDTMPTSEDHVSAQQQAKCPCNRLVPGEPPLILTTAEQPTYWHSNRVGINDAQAMRQLSNTTRVLEAFGYSR